MKPLNPRSTARTLTCTAFLAAAFVGAAGGADQPHDPAAIKFFEEDIRPLLASHCYKCHGDEKQKGGLRLDSLGAMLAGGDTGPVVHPGDPEKSLMIVAVRYGDEDLQMPPKERLSAHQVAALERWIQMGAPWPGQAADGAPAVRSGAKITDEDRAYWFYQPLSRPAPPQVSAASRVRNAVDQFVLSRLEAHDLTLAPPADKATLIRRATFDLTGLPPTPREIEAFVNDASPDAYERLIDRLLASPRYGERWGRHWLDLVRYADSDGYKTDDYRPHIWRYRDWVIEAINADMPWDRFVQMQLAGDELFPDDPQANIALGYLRLWPYEFNQRNVKQQWDHILDDATKITSEVFLGMSMGCARCHNHKFDPILQEDYFKVRAFLAPILPDDGLFAATPSQRAEYEKRLAEWEAATADIREKIEAIIAPVRKRLEHPAITKYTEDIQQLLTTDPHELSPLDRQVRYLANLQLVFEHSKIEDKIKGEQREKLDGLRKELEQFDQLKPKPYPAVMAVRDVAGQPPVVSIPDDRRQRTFEPGYPTVLGLDTPDIQPVPHNPRTTGRRATLAKWLSSPDNAPAMRVIANRLWQYHFTRGIVPSANDFGRLGEPPSHPQLLDWLATELPRRGFSLKAMHKLIMTSATYMQGSLIDTPDKARYADLDNSLLWRYPVRRLSAEEMRDAMLAVSGELDDKMGGPGVDESSNRRSVYVKFMRNTRPPLNAAFDGPDGFNSIAHRVNTTTAPQALMLINGDWVLARSRQLASRVQREARDVEGVADHAFRLAFGRAPTQTEAAAAAAFLREQSQRGGDTPVASDDAPPGDLAAMMKHALPDSRGAARIDLRWDQKLTLEDNESLAFDEFTIDAVIYLQSLAEDAKVRVIAAQWDGRNTTPGWSFGVTSTKSRYEPRNLILQFIGRNEKDALVYEVVASNLRPQLHRLYHVAASVKLSDTGKAGVTFHLRDLSGGGKVQTAQAEHQVIGGIDNSLALTLGARDKSQGHGWDGLLDNVRLFNKALTYEELTKGRQPRPFVAGNDSPIVADWRFEPDGYVKDSSGRKNDLTSRGARPWLRDRPDSPSAVSGPVSHEALADLCHVLLNANEFLYVD